MKFKGEKSQSSVLKKRKKNQHHTNVLVLSLQNHIEKFPCPRVCGAQYKTLSTSKTTCPNAQIIAREVIILLFKGVPNKAFLNPLQSFELRAHSCLKLVLPTEYRRLLVPTYVRCQRDLQTTRTSWFEVLVEKELAFLRAKAGCSILITSKYKFTYSMFYLNP